jgi:hypothetical protein
MPVFYLLSGIHAGRQYGNNAGCIVKSLLGNCTLLRHNVAINTVSQSDRFFLLSILFLVFKTGVFQYSQWLTVQNFIYIYSCPPVTWVRSLPPQASLALPFSSEEISGFGCCSDISCLFDMSVGRRILGRRSRHFPTSLVDGCDHS